MAGDKAQDAEQLAPLVYDELRRLAVDGFTIASVRPLWGVLTLGLAAGVALAALLIEPSTASAMLPE